MAKALSETGWTLDQAADLTMVQVAALGWLEEGTTVKCGSMAEARQLVAKLKAEREND